jgi:hypothetical protein
MSKPHTTAVLIAGLLGLSGTIASADVWTWTDPLGETHFVSTDSPLFVWLDADGKVHYSDKPEDETAKPVQLTWHSYGDVGRDSAAYPGETEEDRQERLRAEAYYCKRATEIYDSYVNAPDLYRTDEEGHKIYLTKSEMEQTIADTKARKDELCG